MRLTLMGSLCEYLAALAEPQITAAKRYSDFYREREALAISVDSVREIWPGSNPVDFVQCKYSVGGTVCRNVIHTKTEI